MVSSIGHNGHLLDLMTEGEISDLPEKLHNESLGL